MKFQNFVENDEKFLSRNYVETHFEFFFFVKKIVLFSTGKFNFVSFAEKKTKKKSFVLVL
jgi:hypothetical protein